MGLISIMEKITTGPDILVSGRLGGGSEAIYDVFLKLWLGLGGGGGGGRLCYRLALGSVTFQNKMYQDPN